MHLLFSPISSVLAFWSSCFQSRPFYGEFKPERGEKFDFEWI